MGLSNFPSTAEGMLPILVMNTVLSVAILKNLVRSVLEIMGDAGSSWASPGSNPKEDPLECGRGACKRRVSITQFKALCEAEAPGDGWRAGECSVCLSRFEEEEEVSELSCKHFFHKCCLDKWFHNHNSTCPLCRSIS